MAEDPVETPFNLKLSGPGISIDRDVTEPIALAVVQVAFGAGLAPRAPALPNGGAMNFARSDDGRRLSLREFMQESGAKTYSAKIVVTGRYLRDVEGTADFSRDDVRDRFRSAGEPPASNLPRDFGVAVGAGWIAEDHQNRGRYYVTRTGDEAAEKRFEGGAQSVKVRRRRKATPGDAAGEQSNDHQGDE